MVALKREAYQNCISKIAEIAGVDEDKAFSILNEVADTGNRLRKRGIDNPFSVAAAKTAIAKKTQDVEARVNALRDTIKKQDLYNNTQPADGNYATWAQNLARKLAWSVGGKEVGSALSVQSKWHTLARDYQSSMEGDLRSQGLLKIARSGMVDSEIAEAKWRLNHNGQASRPDINVSPQAQRIAETIVKNENLMVSRANAAGANIKLASNFVDHTNWDPTRIRKAGGTAASMDASFQQWAKDVTDNADPSTFDGLSKLEKTGATSQEAWLRGMYNSFITGNHYLGTDLGEDANGFIPKAYEDTTNIAKKISQSRTLIWKDSQSYLNIKNKYMKGGTLYSQALDSADHLARHTALIDSLGNNPEANFNTVVEKIRNQITDPTQLSKFDNIINGSSFREPGAKNMLGKLTGNANRPANEMAAQLFNGYFQIQNASKMGNIPLIHLFSAPMTVTSELSHHGISRLDGLWNLATSARRLGNKDAIKVGNQLKGYTAGANIMAHSRHQEYSGIPGMLAYRANQFMKYTGISQLMDHIDTWGVKSMIANKLARNLGNSFDSFHPDAQNHLKLYGIDSKEWDLMRKSQNIGGSVDGDRFYTPQAIDHIPDADMEEYIRSKGLPVSNVSPEQMALKVRETRWDLQDKYGMYLNDAGERGRIVPGVREQAFFTRGTQPGSPGWIIGKALGQYKMWPLAAYNQMIRRDIFQSLSNKDVATRLGWIVALSTLGGAARLASLDAISGRPQKDYTQPATLANAMAVGGGLGIWGDQLFGEMMRSQRNSGYDFAASVLGPTGSDVEGTIKAAWQFKNDLESATVHEDGNSNIQEALKHALSNTTKFAVSHTPYSNLFYLKGALDYMAFYHMYEATDPGWWDRTNQKMQKEQGTTMLGYRPGMPIPYGIPLPTGSVQPLLSGDATSGAN